MPKTVHAQVIDLGTVGDTSFSNQAKQALVQVFKNTRIVVLGEQTHGIADEYLSFARMVKLLHEELGFNVIVQEYCFFTSHRINQQYLDSFSAQEFRKSMYWPQGKSQEYNVLFEYLDQQKEIAPIAMEGFDARIAHRQWVYQWLEEL